MIIDSPIVSGSFLSTGSLSQIGNAQITGSLTVSGSAISLVDGSYSGSGANLFGIPASGITGLNLSQIASGSVSASISPNLGLLINTSVSASDFTGSFTGSLEGIATSASYAAFALTSSYSLGGSGFPFSGSAVITGSLVVSGSGLTITGSVAISTLTTGSGVRYVIADADGLISAQTASAAIFVTQQTIATAGQTNFPITNGYSTGYVTVFVNGTKLNASEYTDTSGTNIVLATGSMVNDVVEFQKYLPASGVSNNALRSINYFTTTLGQTNFAVDYTPGLLDVFYNGSKLSNTEYTAANGTSITLATGSNAGDTLEVDVYSYQVGAFSGIGGTGVARELAFYNTSNSITGSNKVTYDGSTFSVTGSFLVTGSSTFTVDGPAIFSGSVTAVGGIVGTADSASYATTASYSENAKLFDSKPLSIFATTGSNGFTANQAITGSLTVTGQIVAQSLNVQQVTSSIVYSSGSNVFGCDINSRQTFTGSFYQSGSVAVFSNTICATNLMLSSSATCTSFIQSNNAVSAVRSNSGDSADLFLGRCDNTRYTNVLYADSTQWGSCFRWSVGMRTGGSNYNIHNEVCSATALFICQNNNFVGIGTNTPAELFTIYRNANADNRLAIYQGTAGYASAINLIGNDDAGTAYNAILSRTGTGTAHWQIGGGGTANTMVMYTAGCERMRITSIGSVGINTSYSNSVYKFVVKSTTDVNLAFGLQGGEASIESFNDAVNTSKPLRIYGDNLKFYAGAERLRICSTGVIFAQCFINLTDVVSQSNTSTWPVMSFSGANGQGGVNQGAGTYDWGLIKGDTSRGYYGRIIVGPHADNTIDQGFFGSGWTNQFVINQSNGNAYLRGTLTQGSDERVKANICDLSYGISEIMQLRAVSYNKKTFNRDKCGNLLSEGVDTCNRYIGFIAQEVKPLIPEVVNGNENSENPEHGLSVEYQNMVALLVKGMQEQQCTINALKTCLGII